MKKRIVTLLCTTVLALGLTLRRVRCNTRLKNCRTTAKEKKPSYSTTCHARK